MDAWDELVAGLRAGEPRAARRFWTTYGPLLHDVAERRLAGALRRRVGPEDVVQSVCRTFLRRAQGGELALDDAERLWHLLCAIAIAKVREAARFHGRQKRAVGAEAGHEPGAPELPPMVASEPTPEAALLADELENAIMALEGEARDIVILKVQDLTNDEIAQRLGISERTVRRIITKVREQLADRLVP